MKGDGKAQVTHSEVVKVVKNGNAFQREVTTTYNAGLNESTDECQSQSIQQQPEKEGGQEKHISLYHSLPSQWQESVDLTQNALENDAEKFKRQCKQRFQPYAIQLNAMSKKLSKNPTSEEMKEGQLSLKKQDNAIMEIMEEFYKQAEFIKNKYQEFLTEWNAIN